MVPEIQLLPVVSEVVLGIIDTVAEATAPTVGVGASVLDALVGMALVPLEGTAVQGTVPELPGTTADAMVPIAEAAPEVESMEAMATEAAATEDKREAAEC